MANTDSNAILALLKEAYLGQPVEFELYKDYPFLAEIEKDENFVGKYMPLPIVSGAGTSSNSFAMAQTYQAPVIARAFDITTGDRFGFATIDGKAIAQSRNDAGAFARTVETAMDSGLETMTQALAQDLYRSGTGTIGIGTLVYSTGVFTFTNADDCSNFEYGMCLQGATSDGGTPVGGVGTPTPMWVVNRDPIAGTITVSTTFGGTAGVGVGLTSVTYLSRIGDGSGYGNNYLVGLQGWCPATVSSTPFFGVDRSIDRVKYGGLYLDYSSMGPDEALVKALNMLHREGGNPDRCYTNYSTFYALEQKMGGQRIRVEAKGQGSVLGFEGIRVTGGKGSCLVLPDRACPSARALFVELKYAKLWSMRQAPRVIDDDGMEMLRTSSQNAVEVRLGYYAQLAIAKPMSLAQVVMPA